MQIPQVEFGGEGQQMHLAHANGFHPMMYDDLLSEFKASCKINAILFKPFWPGSDPQKLKSWNDFADDLITYFDQRGFKNVIGVGHSLGAIVSLLAQTKRPDLFSKLVLMEPVVLLPRFYLFQYLPVSLRRKMIPPAKIAAKRREHWDSKQQAYDQLRPKRVFKNIPDHIFKAYIDYGTKTNDQGGISLSYSKDWETQVYSTTNNPWKALASIKIPTMIIRGAQSNVLPNTTWEQLNTRLKHINFQEIEDGGHLVPFEQKSKITKVILDFISA